MNDPDMGIWQYFYNEFSEMTSQLDARTNTVAFFFDTRGRLTNKSARYGLEDDFVTLAEYEYGTNGYQYNRLVKVIENDGTTGEESYFYDILGTATNISRFISGAGTYQRGFAYDALGRITTVVYPHKADNTEPYTIRYEYHEQNGLLNKISEVDSAGALKTNLLSGISYDHYGRRKVMTYGNEVTTYYSYDALTGLLNNQEVMKNGILQNVNYAFDAAGNVLSKEDTQNGIKHEYGYDDLNRLLSSKLTMTSAEPGQQENYDETFSYDPLGNILTKDKQGGYGYSDYVYTRAHAVESYTYTRNNLGTPEETDVSIEYDANGNMAKKIETTDGNSKNTTYEWDIENRLSVVKEGSKVISSYLYDHTGERLKKTANGSSVYYLGGMSQIKADANTAYHFIFDGVTRIASIVEGSSTDTFFMHTDNIGSTSMITSAEGIKIQRLVYKAFGKIHAHWENGSWSLGETSLRGGIGFTGQEADDETKLMYYGARYFNAAIGRFISADTMVPDPMNTQDYGRYTYVRNNPVKYTDPSGHVPVMSVKITKVISTTVTVIEHMEVITKTITKDTGNKDKKGNAILEEVTVTEVRKWTVTITTNEETDVVEIVITEESTETFENVNDAVESVLSDAQDSIMDNDVEDIVINLESGFFTELSDDSKLNVFTFGVEYRDIASFSTGNPVLILSAKESDIKLFGNAVNNVFNNDDDVTKHQYLSEQLTYLFGASAALLIGVVKEGQDYSDDDPGTKAEKKDIINDIKGIWRAKKNEIDDFFAL